MLAEKRNILHTQREEAGEGEREREKNKWGASKHAGIQATVCNWLVSLYSMYMSWSSVFWFDFEFGYCFNSISKNNSFISFIVLIVRRLLFLFRIELAEFSCVRFCCCTFLPAAESFRFSSFISAIYKWKLTIINRCWIEIKMTNLIHALLLSTRECVFVNVQSDFFLLWLFSIRYL